MNAAFICDAVRTPFGRYGGSLSRIRADDLGALPIRALMERHPDGDPQTSQGVAFMRAFPALVPIWRTTTGYGSAGGRCSETIPDSSSPQAG
jgi:acetyl-CoA acetyltransferase